MELPPFFRNKKSPLSEQIYNKSNFTIQSSQLRHKRFCSLLCSFSNYLNFCTGFVKFKQCLTFIFETLEQFLPNAVLKTELAAKSKMNIIRFSTRLHCFRYLFPKIFRAYEWELFFWIYFILKTQISKEKW